MTIELIMFYVIPPTALLLLIYLFMKLFIIGGELDCFKTAEETWKEELENPALYWHNIDKFQREHPKLYWQVNENLRKKGVKNV